MAGVSLSQETGPAPRLAGELPLVQVNQVGSEFAGWKVGLARVGGPRSWLVTVGGEGEGHS